MEYLLLLLSSAASALVNAFHRAGVSDGGRVVVFKLDHLGDLVTAIPAIAAIRAKHRGAEITLVVGSWCEELARLLETPDSVIVYDSPRFDRSQGGARRTPARLTGLLPERPYDHAYALREDGAVMRYCLFGGCRARRDRGTVRIAHRLRRLGLALSGRGDPGPLGERETNLRIAGASGGEGDPAIRLRQSDVEAARSEIERASGGRARPVVVLHPGAAWRFRRWPVERYAELATRLSAELGAVIFVTGSGDEKADAEGVLAGGVPGRAVAGEYDLSRAAALISLCDAFVGSDSGVTHLAAAVGVPVVALFGPGDPRRFEIKGPGGVTIYHKLACSPCPQTECDRDAACMKAITVDEVFEAVRRSLGGRREPGGSAP